MAEPLTGEMLVILGFIATYRFISSSPSKIASPRPAHRLWFTLYSLHFIDQSYTLIYILLIPYNAAINIISKYGSAVNGLKNQFPYR